MSAVLTTAAPPEPDRRASPRSTLVCKALLYGDEGAPIKVFLSNISMTGIGLRTTKPLMPGSAYRLSVEAGPLTLKSRVRIVRCHPRDERTWDAGAALDPSDLATARRPQGSLSPARIPQTVSRNPTRMLTPG